MDISVPVLDLKFLDDSGDSAGRFSGYGSIFGNVDSHGDVVEKGAFRNTLREWETRGKLPMMLLNHGGMGLFGGSASDAVPIGKWLSMEENSKGLKVEGQLFALKSELGQRLYESMKAGELDGMSIGYRPRKFTNGTKAGEPRRTLHDVDLVELSVVTFPSNDRSRVGAVKFADDIRSIRDFEAFLREAGRFSHARAKAIAAAGFKAAPDPRDEDEADHDVRSLSARFRALRAR